VAGSELDAESGRADARDRSGFDDFTTATLAVALLGDVSRITGPAGVPGRLASATRRTDFGSPLSELLPPAMSNDVAGSNASRRSKVIANPVASSGASARSARPCAQI